LVVVLVGIGLRSFSILHQDLGVLGLQVDIVGDIMGLLVDIMLG
jgi:hypothetical protein